MPGPFRQDSVGIDWDTPGFRICRVPEGRGPAGITENGLSLAVAHKKRSLRPFLHRVCLRAPKFLGSY